MTRQFPERGSQLCFIFFFFSFLLKERNKRHDKKSVVCVDFRQTHTLSKIALKCEKFEVCMISTILTLGFRCCARRPKNIAVWLTRAVSESSVPVMGTAWRHLLYSTVDLIVLLLLLCSVLLLLVLVFTMCGSSWFSTVCWLISIVCCFRCGLLFRWRSRGFLCWLHSRWTVLVLLSADLTVVCRVGSTVCRFRCG